MYFVKYIHRTKLDDEDIKVKRHYEIMRYERLEIMVKNSSMEITSVTKL